MLFPKNKMKFTTTYAGKTEKSGWVVLEMANVDLEGVNKIYLSMEDIDKIKQSANIANEKLNKARTLLNFGEE